MTLLERCEMIERVHGVYINVKRLSLMLKDAGFRYTTPKRDFKSSYRDKLGAQQKWVR
jgi:transposase